MAAVAAVASGQRCPQTVRLVPERRCLRRVGHPGGSLGVPLRRCRLRSCRAGRVLGVPPAGPWSAAPWPPVLWSAAPWPPDRRPPDRLVLGGSFQGRGSLVRQRVW